MLARRDPKSIGRLVGAAVLLGLALFALGAGLVAWRASETSQRQAVAYALTGGHASRAPGLIIAYGCAGCHAIPGIAGADGQVGPPLSGLRQRVFIGGVMRNTGANLVQWIVDPHSVSPKTAMPVTGISIDDARDVAAFLYTR
jgi:cytochrome c